MKFIFYIFYMPILIAINAPNWIWCKLTGKHFEAIGGPQ